MIRLIDLLKEVLSEDVPDLKDPNAAPIKDGSNCKWDLSTSEIKIFFDITPTSKMSDLNSKWFSLIGVTINKVAQIQHDVLTPVNHVGFILSNGDAIDADPKTGISIRKLDDFETNPGHYICVSVGGAESTLISKFNELKTAAGEEGGYDNAGVARKIPILGTILKRLNLAKETDSKKFFCSELVANLLVRCKIIEFEELKAVSVPPISTNNISKKTTGLDQFDEIDPTLDQFDEIDPTQLYEMIKGKAKTLPVVCDQ